MEFGILMRYSLETQSSRVQTRLRSISFFFFLVLKFLSSTGGTLGYGSRFEISSSLKNLNPEK